MWRRLIGVTFQCNEFLSLSSLGKRINLNHIIWMIMFHPNYNKAASYDSLRSKQEMLIKLNEKSMSEIVELLFIYLFLLNYTKIVYQKRTKE